MEFALNAVLFIMMPSMLIRDLGKELFCKCKIKSLNNCCWSKKKHSNKNKYEKMASNNSSEHATSKVEPCCDGPCDGEQTCLKNGETGENTEKMDKKQKKEQEKALKKLKVNFFSNSIQIINRTCCA